MNKVKILILGAKGQLGSGLRESLKTGKTALGPLDQEYLGHHLHTLDREELDVADTDRVVETIGQLKPQVIINCSGMTHVDNCESNEAQALKVNAFGVRNIAVGAEKVGAKLVHISTDYVFDGLGTKPYEVWDEVKPNTLYGKSKALGEKYALAFCSKTFIVRTAWLYGYYGNNFVKTILHLAQTQGQINVVNDQVGNPTNVEDLTHHLLKLALTCQYGIYHCSGRGVCSWFDFASEIVRLSGADCIVNPCSTQAFPRPAKRPAYSALSSLTMDLAVGNQMRPWQEALDDFFKHKNEKGELFSWEKPIL